MKFNNIVNKILNEDLDAGLKKGIEVEKEHTDIYNELKKMFGDELPWSLEEFSEMIAKDHLDEDPKYYEYLDDMEKKMKANKGVKSESMTAGGAGGVFTAYSGTVDAGEYGGHVGNVDFYAPGDTRIPQGPGKASISSKDNKKKKKKQSKKQKNNGALMPTARRMFPNVS